VRPHVKIFVRRRSDYRVVRIRVIYAPRPRRGPRPPRRDGSRCVLRSPASVAPCGVCSVRLSRPPRSAPHGHDTVSHVAVPPGTVPSTVPPGTVPTYGTARDGTAPSSLTPHPNRFRNPHTSPTDSRWLPTVATAHPPIERALSSLRSLRSRRLRTGVRGRPSGGSARARSLSLASLAARLGHGSERAPPHRGPYINIQRGRI